MVFAAKGESEQALLAGWISWARPYRTPEFVKLAKTITQFLPLITNPCSTACPTRAPRQQTRICEP
jgi:hypothetical protein